MKDARLLNCALCRRQSIICSCCDRGNIYCGDACAEIARNKTLRLANKRYQNTYIGRLKHAAAQKRYLARVNIIKQKVTDHSSQPSDNVLLLLILLVIAKSSLVLQKRADIYCNFCGKPCAVFLRRGFLRTNTALDSG